MSAGAPLPWLTLASQRRLAAEREALGAGTCETCKVGCAVRLAGRAQARRDRSIPSSQV